VEMKKYMRPHDRISRTIKQRRIPRISVGFTMLELMVSIAVIALLSVALSQIFISTLRTNTKTEILKEVKQNGDLAMENMTRMIQNAASVTCASSQELTVQNQDGGTTTFACTSDGTALRISSSSGTSTEYITSRSVTLGSGACDASTLAFTCQEALGDPTSVTISFDLSRTGGISGQIENASESFQTSAVVRSGE